MIADVNYQDIEIARRLANDFSELARITTEAWSICPTPPDLWVGEAARAHRADIDTVAANIFDAAKEFKAAAEALRAYADDLLRRWQYQQYQRDQQASGSPWDPRWSSPFGPR